MIYANLDTIVKINVVDRQLNPEYSFEEERTIKRWWRKDKIIPAGFYSMYYDELITEQSLIAKGFEIVQGQVFYKPYYKIYLLDDKTIQVNCDTYQQAEGACSRLIASTSSIIKIEIKENNGNYSRREG